MRRRLLRLLAIVALSLALLRVSGSIVFAPWATSLLIRAGAALGIYGDEGLEDFYLGVSAIASVIASVLLVTQTLRLARRLRGHE